ncbi:MAG TPA: cysteine desulfurase [Candidatus Hydrogenedentes bacterium]|nr:cysteine desulfurase [Candidatus Hydrogenedentota bacterium]HOS03227.1 cysteine desulfurase [Candidatus Hydrogenedentota bacterium]
MTELDVERIRKDFPALHLTVGGKSLVYLDNAATSQKPQAVIDAVTRYYAEQNANVHRGVHYLSELATDLYEKSRKKVQKFLNAPLTCEIIFTRGATEGVNLVAQTYGRAHVGAGDEVLISAMEHHSNIVPWQMLCEEKGATLRVIPMNDAGELLVEEFEKLLTPRTKMVGLSHVSNALGTVNPVKKMIAMAHANGTPVLVDGAQSAPHVPIDVQDIDCDFFVCSGHKMCGPTGIGVLFGKAPRLDAMPPYQGGGDMILSVTFEKTIFNSLPYKFEAGTPHIEGAIGLGVAVDYLAELGMERIAKWEDELLEYGTRLLSNIEGVRRIGTAPHKAAVLSFTMDCAHPHDIGQIFSDNGVAIRAGHHCAQPVMQRFGVPATARISLAFYNTKADLDAAAAAAEAVKKVFD